MNTLKLILKDWPLILLIVVLLGLVGYIVYILHASITVPETRCFETVVEAEMYCRTQNNW